MNNNDEPGPPAPATLADVWRDPDDPRWREAHEKISRVFKGEARKHPRLRSVPPGQLDDELTDLLAEFWCHLCENRQTLEASRVRGLGAMRIEIWRYLDGVADEGDPAGPRRRMLAHLRNNKVLPSLRADPRFERSGTRGPWLLVRWQDSDRTTSDGRPGPTDDAVAAELPTLPSRLSPQRPDQLPPLVDADALPAFLDMALTLSGRPRRDWDLARMVWVRLQPSPDGVFLLAPTPELDDEEPRNAPKLGDMTERRLDRERWARRVDVVASGLADGMSPRQHRVVVGYCRHVPHAALAASLGVSRGTLHNDIEWFRSEFAAVSTREDLDLWAGRLLLESLLNILEADTFSRFIEPEPM